MGKKIGITSYHPPRPNFYFGRGHIDATRANLPHWNKDNTAAFVTFRLADALPREKLVPLEETRNAWLAAHPQPWDAATVREYYATFDARVQEWLDSGYGACELGDARCREIVEDSLWHFAGERYALYAYVVMPNHVHVVFMPMGGRVQSEIVRDWKRFTAKAINEMLGREGTLWQKESFDTLVRSEKHFETICGYIRRNDLEKAWVYGQG